ncbi:MAG: histidine phosphatase family protein [Acidimicrobiia bacterium]
MLRARQGGIVTKHIEVRRHTDNDGDALTADGIAAATSIGASLGGRYARMWSSGAQRATQTAACLLAGLGEQVPGGVAIAQGLRSSRENEWRAAYRTAGRGDLDALRAASPALVEEETAILGAALRDLLESLRDGERGLAVGHSPMIEAAVHGLAGVVVPPLAEGAGVLVEAEHDRFGVESLAGP